MPSHKHYTQYTDVSREWSAIVTRYSELARGNPSFAPMAEFVMRLAQSAYVREGLSGTTSMHDLLIAPTTDILRNPHLRISWDPSRREFRLLYEDGSKTPWERTASAEQSFEVLERFLTKRARWYRAIRSDDEQADA